MSMVPSVSCIGIRKAFDVPIHPTDHLQDRLLRWRRYGKTKRIEALQGVDCHVQRGEWLGLTGPNGSGKTTLLRIIAGLLPPDRGVISCSEACTAFLGLGTGFHPERTAVENVYMHGLLHGLTPATLHRTTDAVIAFAGVESHRDLPLKCFSAGMQLRLAYAATVFIDSPLYLFDEILAVGDSAFQEQCRQHMHALKRAGKTVLFVSHDLSDLREYCDRIVHLDQGLVVREEI